MHNDYVEQRNNGFFVAGTRISLDSVVYSFNRRAASLIRFQADADFNQPSDRRRPA